MKADPDPRVAGVTAAWNEMEPAHRAKQPDWREASVYTHRSMAGDGARWAAPGDGGSYDDTASHAAWQAAAQVQGAAMPRGAAWFTLHDANEGMNLPRAERIWFQQAADHMHAMFAAPDRALYMHAFESLESTVTLGNGPLFLGDDPRSGAWFRALALAQCRMRESERGIVDQVGRRWTAPPAAIIREYGAEAAGPECRELAQANSQSELELTWLVDPRPGGEAGGFARNKPWRSIVVIEAHGHVIRESGFDTFPFAWPRHSRQAGCRYGDGITTRYLSAHRVLNEYAMRFLQSAQLAVAPPMWVPGEGILNEFSLGPFALNYFDPMRFGLQAPEAIKFGDRTLPVTAEILNDQRAILRRLYAVDWLDIATDRQLRVQFTTNRDDRLKLQAPSLERLTNEALSPIIAHSFSVAMKRRMFAEPPASIQRRQLQLHIGYQSPLTRLQQFGEIDAIVATTQYAQELAQFDPTARFVLDTVEAVDAFAKRSGAPAAIIRAREDIAAAIEQANEQAAQAQQAEAMQRGAAAVRDVAHAQSMSRGPGQASQPRQRQAA